MVVILDKRHSFIYFHIMPMQEIHPYMSLGVSELAMMGIISPNTRYLEIQAILSNHLATTNLEI